MSSFFWGYIVTQIPSGQLAKRFGPKVLLSCSFGLCSIFAMLTHVASHYGGWKVQCLQFKWLRGFKIACVYYNLKLQWMCALRVLQGLTQGTIFPSSHTLLSKWVPPSERARLSTFVYSGQAIGNVVMLAVSGFIASSSLGWPGIFYISGGLGLVWTVVWIFLGSNSPEVNQRISVEEKEYIQSSLGQITDVEELKVLREGNCTLKTLQITRSIYPFTESENTLERNLHVLALPLAYYSALCAKLGLLHDVNGDSYVFELRNEVQHQRGVSGWQSWNQIT